MDKNEKTKKKKKLRWQIKLFILLILIILYSVFLGTKFIMTKDFNINSSKIDDKLSNIKIVQFSDILYKKTTNKTDIDNLIKKINKAKPDIVIFTGDLINKNYKLKEAEIEYLKEKLSSINSELGKYYVTGEQDNDSSKEILNISGFNNLNEYEQLIYPSLNTTLLLIGKDKALDYNNQDQNIFKLLAIHNPNDFDKFKDSNYDMVISGHNLNGQINIPFIKDLFITSKYKSNYQKINNTKLFINPGIGNNKINARLFNHPTIYLYRLNSKK